MKITQHNFIEDRSYTLMCKGGKILKAKTQLLGVIDKIGIITGKAKSPQTKFGDNDELSSIDVFENGIVLTFNDDEEDHKGYDKFPVEAKAYIFTDGEIHYIFTKCGFDGEAVETTEELDKKMGDMISLVPRKNKIFDKITNAAKKNEKIGELCNARVKRLLENTKEFLAEDKEIVDRIVEHLDDNDKNWNTEMMVSVAKNEFAEYGDKLTDDVITSAIITHMEHGGKSINESFEFEDATKKRKVS